MKKSLLLFSLISVLILFTGCPLKPKNIIPSSLEKEKTVLNIQNQSSIAIKNIKYNGSTFNLLKQGDMCSLELNNHAPSYIYFTLFSEEKNIEINVRTKDTFIVQKNKVNNFRIIDNMLIVEIGKVEAFNLLNFINPAVLKVKNNTSWDIAEISYGGKTHKETISIGKEWKSTFSTSMQNELKIKIFQKKKNAIVTLKLKDNISIEIGKTKEVIIDNTSLALEDGKKEVAEIRQFLGTSVLKIINQSSAKAISSIGFAGILKETSLSKGEELEIEYGEAVEDFISFKIKNEQAEFAVKTSEKIKLEEKDKKTLILTDETSVMVPSHQTPVNIKDILDAALITIKNESRADLSNVTYAGINLDTVQKKGSGQNCLINFSQIPDHIHFSIYNATSGKNIKAKTVEKFSIAKRETKTFTITDTTMLLSEDAAIPVALKALLGIGSLKIINQSSIEILDIKYSDKKISEILSKNAMAEIEFEVAIEAYLEFTIKNGDKTFKVKTSEKIKVDAGEEKVFNITDGTLISLPKHKISVNIKNVLDAAFIKIKNETRTDITDVVYAGADLGVVQKNDSAENLFCSFAQTPNHIQFTVYQPSSGKTITVKTKDRFHINEKEHKEFTITESTVLINEETEEETSVKEVLGITTLKVINQSSSPYLSNISCSGITHKKNVKKNMQCELELNGNVQDYIVFYVKSTFASFKVKTANKISIESGKEKIFTINDNTKIMVAGLKDETEEYNIEGEEASKVLSLETIIEAAALDIINASFAELFNVTYDNVNTGTFPAYDGQSEQMSYGRIHCWDFKTTETFITFEITVSSNLVKFRTVKPIILSPYSKSSFKFTNQTEIINIETGVKTSITKLLGLGSLKIINNTSAKAIFNINYGKWSTNKDFSLLQGETFELQFKNTIDDYIAFSVKSRYLYEVHTADKFLVNLGEEKTFTITDETLLAINEYPHKVKITNLLNASLENNVFYYSPDRLYTYFKDGVLYVISNQDGTYKCINKMSYNENTFYLSEGESMQIIVTDTSFMEPDGSFWSIVTDVNIINTIKSTISI